MKWPSDRLAEPCEYDEPTDNWSGLAHGLILGVLLVVGLWIVGAF